MNKKLRTGLLVLIAVILLVTMTSAAFAGNRQEFSLVYDAAMGDLPYRADGTFVFTKGIEDGGEAYLTWGYKLIRPYTIFFDGDEGSFTAQMKMNQQTSVDCWAGSIIIWASKGTGDYENMGGAGQFTQCREFVEGKWHLDGTIDGWISEYIGKG